ncbi:LuxR family maltose regulon positive regulatory protein [Nocardioides ginsengisegetis]|uniref:LuxR family maltose regulon positive regulatory protein n=1 Tax=Nocardioides ginsengisegetis TaxID=661491 RepID=A0A7W3P8L1_9ACTN|nr:LuxR C-terminal-related transcriptional regulator [Nocardioides ginsengisegetis]MBA8802511.1 LuxR family maltose regulon positive regulatory protein [Nocardioides ginsengisegetis]
MADPLVETKLLAPRPRRALVPRPRLDDLLRRASDSPVTVVSAPAGFGKTTLVTQWLTGAGDGPVAWVALDERDRDATSFWTYVLQALDRAVPGSAAAALTLLRSGQAPVEAVLAGLVNELSVHFGEVTLVLDDYHLADGVDVASGMTFLVDHLPPQLRLVLATRADPALPLSRLRARGELVEVRAADLRFTREEVADYLNDLHGFDLASADITALESRTEGWVAALQLAALSLRDRDDPSAFIAGFAGDDRFVVDYLADEVLARQPDDVRRFLLDTSILDRLTGPLCDAVSPPSGRTSGGSGRSMLDTLERAGLFLVALDDRRGWFRYHHLFGDVLHAHLLEERPDEVRDLHRRAAGWWAEEGDTVAAVRHALAAGDADRAAGLAELAIPHLRRDRREDVIRRWADDLPADVVGRRPVLAIGLVGGLMASNDFDGVDGRLRDVERMLAGPATDLVVEDAGELARVPAAVAMYGAALTLIGGDPAGTVARAHRALELAAGDDLVTGAAAALSGLASWTTGDIEAAHRSYATSMRSLTRAGHVADVLGCPIAMADMELRLGRLRDADRTLVDALELARTGPGDTVVRGTADMLVGLSRTAWYRNDLAGSAEHLRHADELGEAASLAQNPYRWRVGMARLRAAEGDLAAALELLDEAERVYVGDYSPNVQPVHASRARVLAARGDLAAALAWASRHRVAADDDLTYLREYEHITLARILLAEHAATGSAPSLRDAATLLDRLLAAAAAGGRFGTVIELEVLRCQALRATGGPDPALAALRHAVELAEPDGWIRVFVDASPAVTDLLRTLAEKHPRSGFLRELVAAAAPAPVRTARVDLVDPLSDRELDVLRLLRSDLDGPAIARELVVSLNTVRTHTKHIYAKLGVNNRRAAISRAHQLGLLGGSAR